MEDCRATPVTYRVDTQYNVRRAVLSGWTFANLAKVQIEKKRVDWSGRSEELAEAVAHLDWSRLRVPWTKWFLGGLK
jgi:hypothetical protein